MKKILFILALLLCPLSVPGQQGALQGTSTLGGISATTQGAQSSNKLQGVIPAAKISIYLTNTTTLATLTTDGTHSLSNPFYSNASNAVNPGGFVAFAATNVGYDIVASSGQGVPNCTTGPLCYTLPVTLCKDCYPTQSFTPVVGAFQTNGVNNSNQALLNHVDTATVKFTNPSGGVESASVPNATNSSLGAAQCDGITIKCASGVLSTIPGSGLDMFVNAPTTGTWLPIYPTGYTITGQQSYSTATASNTAGQIVDKGCPGLPYCAEPLQTTITWTFTIPSYINPSNITSIYATGIGATSNFGTGGGFSPSAYLDCYQSATTYILYTGINVNSPQAQYNVHLTGVTGSQIPTITCAASVSANDPVQGSITNSVPAILLQVEDSVDTPPTSTNVNVLTPLYYNPSTQILGIDPLASFQGLNVLSTTVAGLPVSPTLYATYRVRDGSTATDCTTGSGSDLVDCYWNGSSYVGSSVGSGGFPITLGSTSIAASSTTTALTGLSVNGVTLDATGAATLYLDKTGNYSTPAGGGGASATQGSPVIGTGTGIVGSLYTFYPDAFDTGSGTEGSPWSNADNSAGINTQLAALGSGRGGQLNLAPGRFNIATPILLTQNSVTINGIGQGGFAQPNGAAEGTWGEKLRLNASLSTGAAMVQVGTVGGSYGSRISSPIVQNNYLWGTTATPAGALEDNVGILVNGWADQPKFIRNAIGNFGVAIEAQSPTGNGDAETIADSNLTANGYGIVSKMDGTNGNWFNTIRHNVIADNAYQGLYELGNGGTANGVSGAGDFQLIEGNPFVRNCTSSTCAGMSLENANIYWERNAATFIGNSSATPGFNGSTWVNADGLIVYGAYNNFVGNRMESASQTGDAGVRVLGNNNQFFGNAHRGNATDYIVASGASDNYIYEPGATVTDSGTRTVINGWSTNAGDPNSAGDWNGQAKWAGLNIWDTTNSNYYEYTSPSNRILLNSAGLVTSITATSPCTANGASGTPETGSVTVYCPSSGGSTDFQNLSGSVSFSATGGSGTVTSGTFTLTGAASKIVISGIPSTFAHLRIEFRGQTSNASTEDGIMQFNSDTGAHYDWVYLNGNGSSAASGASNADTQYDFVGLPPSTSTGHAANAEVIIHNYATTGFYRGMVSSSVSFGSNSSTALLSGEWLDTADAITSITLSTHGGHNFPVGTAVSIDGFN